MSRFFSFFSSPVFAGDIVVPPPIPRDRLSLWSKIIPGFAELLLILALIFSLFYLLWGGISWITSGGSKENLEAAKKKITYALLGLILTLISFAIIFTFGELLGVDFSNF